MRSLRFLVMLGAAATASACGLDGLLTPSIYERDVTAVVSGSSTVGVGGTTQLSVTLNYSDNTSRVVNLASSGSVTLTSSNTNVATVTRLGIVTGVTPGQVTITATPTADTTGTGRRIAGTILITVVP